MCGFFAFTPIYFEKTTPLSLFIKFNWLILLKSHFNAKNSSIYLNKRLNFSSFINFFAFLYKKFHFYYEFNKKLVILDMQMRKLSSFLMPLALISISTAGKNVLYVYDARLNTNNYIILLKYYYFKRILIKQADFIRQLLFPDHGFG